MTPVAVVTGGNRGIGAAVVKALEARGMRVVATARGAGAAHPLDVRDAASVAAFARDVGAVDVLVNNAGVAMDGFDERVARETLDVNFHGPVRVTDALLPALRPGARVVMVSSGLGDSSILGRTLRERFLAEDLTRDELLALVARFVREVGEGTHARSGWPSSAYGVSKAALNAQTRLYARDLARDPRRILVNAVCPGWVRTDMGGPGAPRSPEEGAAGIVWAATLPDGGPSGRLLRDREVVAF